MTTIMSCNHLIYILLLACLQDFSGGLLWPTSRRNTMRTHSCSTLHPYFRLAAIIARKCNDDGTWGPVDDSSCSALNNAIPTLIISFKLNISKFYAQHVVDKVSLDIFVYLIVLTCNFSYVKCQDLCYLTIMSLCFRLHI